MQDTNKKLIKALSKIIARRRKLSGKSMYKISAEASMSKSTWREAELGICSNMSLSTLWKIAEGLDIKPNILIEEMQNELGENFSMSDI